MQNLRSRDPLHAIVETFRLASAGEAFREVGREEGPGREVVIIQSRLSRIEATFETHRDETVIVLKAGIRMGWLVVPTVAGMASFILFPLLIVLLSRRAPTAGEALRELLFIGVPVLLLWILLPALSARSTRRVVDGLVSRHLCRGRDEQTPFSRPTAAHVGLFLRVALVCFVPAFAALAFDETLHGFVTALSFLVVLGMVVVAVLHLASASRGALLESENRLFNLPIGIAAVAIFAFVYLGLTLAIGDLFVRYTPTWSSAADPGAVPGGVFAASQAMAETIGRDVRATAEREHAGAGAWDYRTAFLGVVATITLMLGLSFWLLARGVRLATAAGAGVPDEEKHGLPSGNQRTRAFSMLSVGVGVVAGPALLGVVAMGLCLCLALVFPAVLPRPAYRAVVLLLLPPAVVGGWLGAFFSLVLVSAFVGVAFVYVASVVRTARWLVQLKATHQEKSIGGGGEGNRRLLSTWIETGAPGARAHGTGPGGPVIRVVPCPGSRSGCLEVDAAAIERLPEDQVRALFEHECHHLHRNPSRWTRAHLLGLALGWPVSPFAALLDLREEEFEADEAAVRAGCSPATLSRALVSATAASTSAGQARRGPLGRMEAVFDALTRPQVFALTYPTLRERLERLQRMEAGTDA